MSKLKEFVENKKGYELKCKVAQEMADNASKGFAEFVYNMTKDAKPEEVSELIESKELDNDEELYGMASMLMLEKCHDMEN